MELIKSNLIKQTVKISTSAWQKPVQLSQQNGYNLGFHVASLCNKKIPEMSAHYLLKTSFENEEYQKGFFKGYLKVFNDGEASHIKNEALPYFKKNPEIYEALQKKDISDPNSTHLLSLFREIRNGVSLKKIKEIFPVAKLTEKSIQGFTPDAFYISKKKKIYLEFKKPFSQKKVEKIQGLLDAYKNFPHKVIVDTHHVPSFSPQPGVIYINTKPVLDILLRETRQIKKQAQENWDYTNLDVIWGNKLKSTNEENEEI